MATAITGADHKLAVNHATVWGTEVDCNLAGKAFDAEEIAGFVAIPEPLPDESITRQFHDFIVAGKREVKPVIKGLWRFDGALWYPITHLLGDETITVDTGNDFATHALKLTSQTNIFMTLCMADGLTVKVANGFKMSGLTFTGEEGGLWRYELRGIGDDVLFPGTINTTLINATFVTKENWMPFGATRIRMNDKGAGALGAPDVIRPVAVSLVINRVIDARFEANAVGVAAAGSPEWRSAEPLENGFPSVEINMRFPTFTSNNRIIEMYAETFKKMDIFIEGNVIPASSPATNYSLLLEFPALRVLKTVYAIAGRERVVEEVTFEACMTDTAPTGMTVTDPIAGTLKNATIVAYDI
jgi:hypothetical protein